MPGFLPYGRQTIEEDDVAAVAEVLRGERLTTGPAVAAFESALRGAVGAPYAVACGNGTQALHLALLAAGLTPGDRAIVPSVTFLATANAVLMCGAEVVFADVDPETGLLTAEGLEEALERCGRSGAAAVLPVHLAGQTVDLDALGAVCKSHGLSMIADSCHALGTDHRGSPVGSCRIEDFATFSFHPVKTIAMGEGGAVTARDPEASERMARLRHHGIRARPDAGPWAYEADEIGFNYRLSDIHCALGVSQLRKLDRFVARRRELAALYDEALAPLAPHVLPPARTPWCEPAWHLYAVRVAFRSLGVDRAALMDGLQSEGIGTQVHYIPVHTQPLYRARYGAIDLPGAQRYYERTLSLPLFPGMEDRDVERVVSALGRILRVR